MKGKEDGLKCLSDVLETIQLFDLEVVIILKIHFSTVAITFECRQCRDANTSFVSVYCIIFCACLENVSQGDCKISGASIFSCYSLFQLPAHLETLFLSRFKMKTF